MKKILYSVMALAIAAMTFTACEDVPEPYPTPNGGETTNGAAALPYTSANLNTGWTLVEVTAGAQPWSLGQSYAQATGYQKWDGASTKSNKAVEGWLVSPAISTYGKENVKLSFNHTIKYTNNVSNWAANHKVYISTDFDGSKATWTELDFTPVASPYASSDWTLYSSGEIQLPAQFVGKEAVYIGFWFKAPADASTTWELQTFKMEEGIAENTPEPTPTEELGTAEAPLTVAKAIETINKYADNGTSTAEAYVKGTIVSVESYNSQYKSITYWISDDGTENGKMEVYSGKGLNGADFTAKTDLHKGAVVVVKGTLKKYVNNSGTVVQEFDKNNVIVSITNNEGGDTPQPTGDVGSLDAPKTVAEALAAIDALDEGATTSANYYVKGKVVSVATAAEDIGPNSTSGKKYKDINYYIAANNDDSKTIYVYRGKNLNNTDFTSADQLKVGDEVIVYGKLQKYKDTKQNKIVPEMASGNYLVKTSNTNGGNDTPTPSETTEAGTNGNFEAWTGNLPDNWKTTSAACNATLSQSTDAHGGNYSCKVGGDTKANKRLGYKEMSLKAGTYQVTFYAKALSEGGSLNPGIVPVSNGTAGSYAYTGYVDNISTSNWQKVEATITVTADGTYSFVIMNQKKSSAAVDILIDDYTVVCGSTSIIK